jgi:hypothetical protein
VAPVPIKLDAVEVDGFVEYLGLRLRALEDNQVRRIGQLKVESRGDVRVVSFIYTAYQSPTDNFYSRNSLFVEPEEGSFKVRLESMGSQDSAYETGSLIRQIAMEWSNKPR